MAALNPFRNVYETQRNQAAATYGYVLVPTSATVSTKYPGLSGSMARSICNYWVDAANSVFTDAGFFQAVTLMENPGIVNQLKLAVSAFGDVVRDFNARNQFNMPRLTAPDTQRLWNAIDKMVINMYGVKDAPSAWDNAAWATTQATREALTAISNIPSGIFNTIFPVWLRVLMFGALGVWAYNNFMRDRGHE